MPLAPATFAASLTMLAAPTEQPKDARANPTSSASTAEPSPTDVPWIRRWRPTRNTFELGVFGGVLFPHPRLELYEFDDDLPNDGFRALRPAAPDLGIRIAYFPLRVLGIEEEVAVMPSQTALRTRATLWSVRGHLVAQFPRWSITPFALAGVSALGIASERSVVGDDVDMGFHFGAGVKAFVTKNVVLRFDVRDTITARRGTDEGVVHSPELLLGLSVALGNRRPKPAPPADRDGDGILDPDDRCVDTPGVPEYQGCPIPDTDGDGILDPDDQCVDTPGVPEYQGCPIPDTDGDGILDPDDQCVDTPGVPEYQGCPDPDTDGDGIPDEKDQCPNEPETVNGFEDQDGCPDEVPEAVKAFTGVIEGIYFRTNSARIRGLSRFKLNDAVKVLQAFPDLRIEISGHTDDRGYDGLNMRLSKARAEAVRSYLVGAGVTASRIETRGAGETEPIDTNTTEKGRAKNRRIEFKLL